MKLTLSVWLFILFIMPAQAGIIFNNGQNIENTSGACASCNGMYVRWDNFVLNHESKIHAIEFDAAFYVNDSQLSVADFALSLFIGSNAGDSDQFNGVFNLGDSQLTKNRSRSGVFNYTVLLNLSDLTLTAGEYWIGFSGTVDSATNNYMAFSQPTTQLNAITGSAFQNNINTVQQNSTLEIPFRLYGQALTVPEPTTAYLLFIAIVCGLVVKQRSRV